MISSPLCLLLLSFSFFFFFNDTATTEIYTLSLHDALPISAFHRPGGEARLGARCQVTDRVAPAAGEADPLGGAGARPHRTEHEAAVVAAEIVRALAQAQRHAAELVPPRHRHPGAHQPVAPGGLPGRVVEAMLHRPTPRAKPRLPVVQHIV